MGGNAKHMQHIWERYDATFSDVFKLLNDLTTGSIQVTEKFDGANIHFRVDNTGTVKFSRNKETLSSGGFTFKDALTIYQNHPARDLFVEGCRVYDEVYTNKWWPFGYSGRDWINAEIVFKASPQLLNYSESAIVLHQVATFLPNGEKLIDREKQSKIANLTEASRFVSNTGHSWRLFGPQVIELSNDSGTGYLTEAASRLRQCMHAAGLGEHNTLRDFLRHSIYEGFVSKIRTTQHIKSMLADKISGVDSSIRLVDLKRGQPAGIIKQISECGQRKNEAKLQKAAMRPIISTLDTFASARLSNVTSILIDDPILERNRIMQEITDLGVLVDTYNDEFSAERKVLFNTLFNEWNTVERRPAAIEGLTFDFLGTTTKITGGFASLNQLLGIRKYGRGKIPAMTESNSKQNIKLTDFFALE
ncbi:MAG: hypothetical protein H8E12_10540 [Rhodobacteraceae bacterium]|nr:hypothetical protein [Paracoccaceae bacterium]